MALIQFSSLAAGPLLLFQESVEEIFKRIDEPFMLQGGWACDDLPVIAEKLRAAEQSDRAEVKARTEELEELHRQSSTGDKASREREAELEKEIKANAERVNFFQRAVPLLNLIERSFKEGKTVMWQKL